MLTEDNSRPKCDFELKPSFLDVTCPSIENADIAIIDYIAVDMNWISFGKSANNISRSFTET